MNSPVEKKADFQVALDRFLRKPEGTRQSRVLSAKAKAFCEDLISGGAMPLEAAKEVTAAVKTVVDAEHWQKNWDSIKESLDKVAELCEGFLGLTAPEEPPADSTVVEALPAVVTVESLTTQPPVMEPKVAYSDSTSDPGHAILVTLAKDSGIGPEDLMPELDTLYAQEADALREKNPKEVAKLRKASLDLRTKIAELDGGKTALASWYCAKAKAHAQSAHYAMQHMDWLIGGVEFYMQAGDPCLSELMSTLTQMGRMKDGELVPPPPKVVVKPAEKPPSVAKATIVVPPVVEQAPKSPESLAYEAVQAFFESGKEIRVNDPAVRDAILAQLNRQLEGLFKRLPNTLDVEKLAVYGKQLIVALNFVQSDKAALRAEEQELADAIQKRREAIAAANSTVTKPADVPLASDSGSPDMSSGDGSKTEETSMTTSTNGAPAPTVPAAAAPGFIARMKSYVGDLWGAAKMIGLAILVVGFVFFGTKYCYPDFSLGWLVSMEVARFTMPLLAIPFFVLFFLSEKKGVKDAVFLSVGVGLLCLYGGAYFFTDSKEEFEQKFVQRLKEAGIDTTQPKAEAAKQEKQEEQVPKPVDTTVPKEQMADGQPFKPETLVVQPVVPKPGSTLNGKALSDAEIAFFGQNNDQSLFGLAAFVTEGKEDVSVSQQNLADYRAIVALYQSNPVQVDFVSRGSEILDWLNAKAGPNGTVLAQDPAEQGIVDAWLQALKQ